MTIFEKLRPFQRKFITVLEGFAVLNVHAMPSVKETHFPPGCIQTKMQKCWPSSNISACALPYALNHSQGDNGLNLGNCKPSPNYVSLALVMVCLHNNKALTKESDPKNSYFYFLTHVHCKQHINLLLSCLLAVVVCICHNMRQNKFFLFTLCLLRVCNCSEKISYIFVIQSVFLPLCSVGYGGVTCSCRGNLNVRRYVQIPTHEHSPCKQNGCLSVTLRRRLANYSRQLLIFINKVLLKPRSIHFHVCLSVLV